MTLQRERKHASTESPESLGEFCPHKVKAYYTTILSGSVGSHGTRYRGVRGYKINVFPSSRDTVLGISVLDLSSSTGYPPRCMSKIEGATVCYPVMWVAVYSNQLSTIAQSKSKSMHSHEHCTGCDTSTRTSKTLNSWNP